MIRTLVSTLLCAFVVTSCSTLSLPQGAGLPVTETEAAQGVREALDQGVSRGIRTLHREDGFFGNNAYKLFLPAEAQRIESVLRQLGMGAMVDRAILQINRSAEDAVGTAGPIFGDAIRSMTLTDALGVVSGGQDAATQYFRQRTTEKLKSAFTPIIKQSLDKFNATKYYDEIITTYNNFPTTLQKLNPDLTAYVTDKAVTALFDQIAKEEAAIRTSASARSSQILKRVFGRRG